MVGTPYWHVAIEIRHSAKLFDGPLLQFVIRQDLEYPATQIDNEQNESSVTGTIHH